MFWSAPLSVESPTVVAIDARVAPEDCLTMAEVRHGVDALDRALVALLAERQRYMHAAARRHHDRPYPSTRQASSDPLGDQAGDEAQQQGGGQR